MTPETLFVGGGTGGGKAMPSRAAFDTAAEVLADA
jgi:hypothetical protein